MRFDPDKIVTLPKGYEGFFFISDIHLGYSDNIRDNNRLENNLCDVFKKATDQKLYIIILGDLFDYWMEYPDSYPIEFEQIIETIQSICENQNKIPFITGNHDHWTRSYLKDRNFLIETEYLIVRDGDIELFLLHGDKLSNPEFGLPASGFNALIRKRELTLLYQLILPENTGLHIMKWFSNWSKSQDKDHSKSNRLEVWSRHFLDKFDVHGVICGHEHKAQLISRNEQVYLNLGGFYSDFSCAIYKMNEISLVLWNHESNDFNILKTHKFRYE